MSEDIASSYRNVGFLSFIGLEMTHSEEGRAGGRLEIRPEHRNRAGVVHGGVLCTMIDFGACAAGLHTFPGEERRLAITLSLTTQFTKPAAEGSLRVEGKVLSAGRKTYSAEAHVYDDAGDLVAHGIGMFQWRSPPAARTSQDQDISVEGNSDV